MGHFLCFWEVCPQQRFFYSLTLSVEPLILSGLDHKSFDPQISGEWHHANCPLGDEEDWSM